MSNKIETYFTTLADNTDSESSNKRNLSDGSTTGNSPKRLVYDAEDEVIDMPDDVPSWVSALLRTMNNVNLKVEETNAKIEDLALKFDNYKSDIDGKLSVIENTVSELKTEYDQKIADIAKSALFVAEQYEEQKKTNEALVERIKKLEKAQLDATTSIKQDLYFHASSIEEAEQYSRRNCLLLHGVKESDKEDTDALVVATVKEHLAITLEERDIDRTHRLGPPRKDGKARPIIVKFSRYNTRASVFRVKKRFKGTSLLLTESFTKRRMDVLNAARTEFGSKNVWSSDGEIFTKKDGKTINVRFIESLFPKSA